VQLKPTTEAEATSVLPSSNGKTVRSRRAIVPFTHLAREGRMTVTIGRRELLAALGGTAVACPLAARALAQPDAASVSSLREIVAFCERGLHSLHCAERGRSFFTRRPGDRTQRIEACARDTQVGLTRCQAGVRNPAQDVPL